MQQEHGTSAKDNLQLNRPAPLRQTALSSPQLYSDLGKAVYTGGTKPSDHAIPNWPAREPHHERPPGVETSTPGVAIAGQGSVSALATPRSARLSAIALVGVCLTSYAGHSVAETGQIMWLTIALPVIWGKSSLPGLYRYSGNRRAARSFIQNHGDRQER